MHNTTDHTRDSLVMKARRPLLLKILSWLALNLLLVGALGVGFLLITGGVQGWLRGPVGERLQGVADNMTGEMQRGENLETVLARQVAEHGLVLAVYRPHGERLAGADLGLPRELRQWMEPGLVRLRRDDRQPRPPGRDRRPPPRRGEEDRDRRPPPRRIDPEVVSDVFMEELGQPPQWWGAVRLAITMGDSERRRGAVLVAVADSPWTFASLLNLRPVFVAVAVVMLVSVLFWLPLVLSMTRSLRELMRATSAIAEGRFGTRVDSRRNDEIGALATSVDRMAGRLDVLVNGQRKFLADVAHELGSPVGRLQVATSILEERVAAELRPQVADVREEVEQMGELLGELLAFTRAGLSARDAKLQPVVLGDVIEQAVHREAADADVSVDLEPNLVVQGDAKLLLKSVSNILRNAVRYGGEAVHIKVEARRHGANRVRLVVCDNGPGVPPSALEHLGEPFYRPDAARTRRAGGSGLGLSIVRESILAQQGQVNFANCEGGGFEVTLMLLATDIAELT